MLTCGVPVVGKHSRMYLTGRALGFIEGRHFAIIIGRFSVGLVLSSGEVPICMLLGKAFAKPSVPSVWKEFILRVITSSH